MKKEGIDYLLDTESEYDQMDTQRFLDNYKKNIVNFTKNYKKLFSKLM